MTEFERIRKTIDSYCGLSCAECTYRETKHCGGCIATGGKPFHGSCEVAACAMEKKRGFCGECGEFACELLKSYSNDETHGDTPKGARIQRCMEIKGALLQEARKGTDPQGACGHHCHHCFLGQWCGGCRSVYPNCSFATLFEDGKCPNLTCSAGKGLDGCYGCEELAGCGKGYYGAGDGYTAKGAALFIWSREKKERKRPSRPSAEQGAFPAFPVVADALFDLLPGAVEIRRQTADAEEILRAAEHQLAVDGNVVRAQGPAAASAGCIISHTGAPLTGLLPLWPGTSCSRGARSGRHSVR